MVAQINMKDLSGSNDNPTKQREKMREGLEKIEIFS